MKVVIACIVILLLLVIGYYARPGVKSAVADYWIERIDDIAQDNKLTVAQRHDSLVVLSLNLRHDGWTDLSWHALMAADSVMPNESLTKGLIGLYQLEAGRKKDAIESWRAGAEIAPTDPNLSYLATLDTVELGDVDDRMLEKMFVDTLTNARLKVKLYHRLDTDVVSQTEQRFRIRGSIDTTFFVASGLGFVALYMSIRQLRRARGMLRDKGEADRSKSMPKSISYVVVISSLLKIGQILGALYNYFTLGVNLSSFTSKYILTPENLFEVFRSNIVFALIFVLIVLGAVFRKRIAAVT